MKTLGGAFGALFVVSAVAAQVAPADLTKTSADSVSSGVPQRDVFDILKQLLNRDIDPEVALSPPIGLQWALLPSVSYNPVYGVALGASLNGAGRRGLMSERYSSVAISGSYSTTGQIQFLLRGDTFTPGGNYLLKTDVRYLDTERSTWGLGPTSALQEEYPMQFKLVRVYGTLYRRMSGPVFVGAGYHFDQFSDIVDARAENGEATPFSIYSNGTPSITTAAGISLNILADTRDNLVNSTRGFYSALSLRDYYEQMGSDAHWQELWVESRVYTHLPASSRHVLAFWFYGWMTFGPAPYLNLPTNGWDTYGRGARGYLAGRIRGADQMYLESEYRRVLTSDGLLGAVAFVNLTLTTEPETETFGTYDAGGGVGLRIKFNKRSNMNLTIDYGIGSEGQRGLFLGMTEVF
jgi:hypothetical protein